MNFFKLKLPISAFIAILFLCCNSKNNPGENATNNTGNKTDTFSYPYKATYSSDITAPSHPDYAPEVLTVWKKFESNEIDSIKKYFADTVTYENAEGMRFYGSSDELLNLARKDIESLDSLRFDISMWQSLHVNDRNEDWVYIWASERRYTKNGGSDTTLIHEQWKIKDNKIVFFNQYHAKLAK
jgi:hypothetical protein